MKHLLALLLLGLAFAPASAQGKVFPTGVVVPKDIKARHEASWAKHGPRMMSMPKVVATKWDAADFGFDSPVDDQGNCGSCHLFAGTGGVECAQLKEGHKGVRLSKQQVMDCANTGDCNGGWPEDTLAYAKKVGIATVEQYGPYRERRQACKSTAGMKLYKLKDYGYVTRSDSVPSYQEIKDSTGRYGPLVVCVAADNRFMNADPDSVFDGNASGINHAVMITGYDDDKVAGTQSPKPAFSLPTARGPAVKMKNSWSTKWVKDGYLWMRPGANQIGYGAMWCVAEDTLPDPTPPVPPVPPGPTPPGPSQGQVIVRIPGLPDKVLPFDLPAAGIPAGTELVPIGTVDTLKKLKAITDQLKGMSQNDAKQVKDLLAKVKEPFAVGEVVERVQALSQVLEILSRESTGCAKPAVPMLP